MRRCISAAENTLLTVLPPSGAIVASLHSAPVLAGDHSSVRGRRAVAIHLRSVLPVLYPAAQSAHALRRSSGKGDEPEAEKKVSEATIGCIALPKSIASLPCVYPRKELDRGILSRRHPSFLPEIQQSSATRGSAEEERNCGEAVDAGGWRIVDAVHGSERASAFASASPVLRPAPTFPPPRTPTSCLPKLAHTRTSSS